MARRSANSAPRSGVLKKTFRAGTKPITKEESIKRKKGAPKKEWKIPFNEPEDKVKGVPFVKLFANAIATDSKYVSDVTVTSIKKGEFDGWPGVISRTVTVDGKGKPRIYNHHIVARDHSSSLRASKAIHVSCQCARFLYYYEYSLWTRGAADILYCNGEYPVVRNPRLIPSACKHLLAVMEVVAKKKF